MPGRHRFYLAYSKPPTPKHPYPACFNPNESIYLWTIGLGSARIFWRIGWRLGVRIQCDY